MWNPGWDEVFRAKDWGSYPPEELVRFMGRNFFQAPDRRAVKVLEIGCGAGANLLFLAQEGFDATGLDGSAVALERAAARLAARGLSARLDRGDAIQMPYADASFDCVLDIECVYANTLADSRLILAEAHRVLKPGGGLFSKTFMTGTSGEATGQCLEGETNTFLEIPDGPFNKGYGIIRLTAEEEIPALYGAFADISVDFTIRSDQNRSQEVREWLITCRKKP
jgi:SAM-dependent methyltransferase